IVTAVPATATTGPLVVTVNGVTSVAIVNANFEVPHPAVTSLTPTTVPVNGNFTITGSGFGASSLYSPDGVQTIGVGRVYLNGVSLGVVPWSDTQIVTSSASPGTGTLTVQRYNANSNGLGITVAGAPTVTGISPPTAQVGSTVTLAGTGFGATQG